MSVCVWVTIRKWLLLEPLVALEYKRKTCTDEEKEPWEGKGTERRSGECVTIKEKGRQ